MSAQAQVLVPRFTGRKANVTPFRATRFDLHLPLKYRLLGERDWRKGVTENVSRSGVLFRANEKLSLHTQLEFNLVLPVGAAGPSPAEVVCRGEVVRSADANNPTLAAKIVQYRCEHGAKTA